MVAFGNWNFQIISVRISHFSRSIIESFQSTTEANELRFSRGCWRSEQELLCKQRLKIVLTHIKTHISSLESQMIVVTTFLLARIPTIKHKYLTSLLCLRHHAHFRRWLSLLASVSFGYYAEARRCVASENFSFRIQPMWCGLLQLIASSATQRPRDGVTMAAGDSTRVPRPIKGLH